MENDTSEITVIFRIILPFWIDFPNESVFEKQYNGRSYTIKILQNLWQIQFRSPFQTANFLVIEEVIIDREFFKPRINFDYLNLLDLTMEKEFNVKLDYSSRKVRTVLEISLNISYIDNEDEILKFINEENIWEDTKELINFFLSLYTYIRINSNFKDTPIFPLSNDYYTMDNTRITYRIAPNSQEILLEKSGIYLQIPIHFNYNKLISEQNTLNYFSERFSRRDDLKMKLEERMNISIEFARKLRDIDSMIVNICIYLERISIDYLFFKRDLDKPELDILYKENGLKYYVEAQLPHFLENSADPQIIKDAIELVRKRNEIVHLGANHSFDRELLLKCENTLKLIRILKEEMEPNREGSDFEFRPKPIGKAIEVGIKNQIRTLMFESELESDYNLRNSIDLSKISDKSLKREINIEVGFQNFELPEEFSRFLKLFSSKKEFILIFALDPTQIYLNLKMLDKILIYLKNNIELEKIIFYFITKHIPTGTLKLLKEVVEKKLNKYSRKLKIIFDIHYYPLFLFKDNKEKELFMALVQLFESTDNNTLSEEIIFQEFNRDQIQDLFARYPDFFRKIIIDGKYYWTMLFELRKGKLYSY